MKKIKISLILLILSISSLTKGETITQTYSSTISNLCSNRTCTTDFETLVFNLPEGAAANIEVVGVDIAYTMTDCSQSNFSRVVCANTDLSSPTEQGNIKKGNKSVSHTNLNIANGIYSTATDIEFDMQLVGGNCFCTSLDCDIVASTWTITLHYNPIYFNSICEVAQSIESFNNSACCDELIGGDTYLTPDRWYYFYIDQYDYRVDFNNLNSLDLSTTYYYTQNDCDNLIEVSDFINIPPESVGYVKVACDDPIQGNCDAKNFELCISTIPAPATINYGDTCFDNNLIEGCTEKWYSFIATGTSLSYTTCTEDFSNATTTLYKGICDQFVSLSSHNVDFEECKETQFSGLVPGEEYWLHIITENDGCLDYGITSLCLLMNTPCETDLLLEGEIVDVKNYESFKSITLDSVQLKAPGSLFLTAVEYIDILENSNFESSALLDVQIITCKELTCGDSYDDDDDGLLDCDDPDCIDQLPLCALGGTLFYDVDQNGLNTESGISGINVQLFTEGDDPVLDNHYAITISDENGDYLFFDLDAGNYFVYISSVYSNYPSVSPSQINEDNGIDNDNNGIQSDLNNDNVTDGPIVSPLISLCPGTEPTGDGDGNASDMTIDIGFTTAGCMSTYECDCNDGIDNDGDGLIDTLDHNDCV